MRELHDGLAVVTVRAELGEVDALDPAGTNTAYACRDLVHLAAHAQSGRGRQERKRRDDEAEAPADRGQSSEVPARRRAEEDDADDVRETRRPAVLDRPFAEARLQHLEVEQARQAVAASEGEADRKLRREQTEDQPP